MATRADFTDEEWKAMQEGITGAGLFVALVDRGFFDSFKEANALAHHLREAHEQSDSVLIRDLATGHDRPFGMTSSPAEVEQSTVETLQRAVAVLIGVLIVRLYQEPIVALPARPRPHGSSLPL